MPHLLLHALLNSRNTHIPKIYIGLFIFLSLFPVSLMFCSRPVRGSLGAAVGSRLFGLIQIFEQSGRLRGDHFRTRCRTKFSSFGQAHSQIVRTCRCLIRVLSRSAGRSSLGFGQSFGKLLRDLRANTNQLTLQGACDAACIKNGATCMVRSWRRLMFVDCPGNILPKTDWNTPLLSCRGAPVRALIKTKSCGAAFARFIIKVLQLLCEYSVRCASAHRAVLSQN